jgi:hypothetical protein
MHTALALTTKKYDWSYCSCCIPQKSGQCSKGFLFTVSKTMTGVLAANTMTDNPLTQALLQPGLALKKWKWKKWSILQDADLMPRQSFLRFPHQGPKVPCAHQASLPLPMQDRLCALWVLVEECEALVGPADLQQPGFPTHYHFQMPFCDTQIVNIIAARPPD